MNELAARVTTAAELVAYQEGSVVSRTVVKEKTGSITIFAFDRGQELSEHTAPFDALVQVLEGTGSFAIAGKAHRVAAGQMLLLPSGVPHAVRADVAFKMMLTMIRTAAE